MKDGTRKHARKARALLVLLVTGIVLGGCGLLDLLPPLPPDQAPSGVTASLGQFEHRIQVSWAAVERATTYKVSRAESSAGPFQALATPVTTPLDDLGVEQGRLYWYKVQACNETGCGPESAAVVGYAGYPPAPANVQASDDFSDKIVITWDPIPGATHYQVHRDTISGGTFPWFVGQSTGNQIEDTTASAGRTYWYVVKACRTDPPACGHLSPADSGCRAPCPPRGSLDAEAEG